MKRVLSGAVFIALLSIAAGGMRQPATQPVGLEQLKWMSGAWVMEKGALRVEEHWTEPRAGAMFGIGRTMKGERTAFFEYLRVEQTPDGITYWASPRGRSPATPFRMTGMSADKVVFENPEHDFPNRIIYWREADGTLRARVEGTRGGQAASESWTFRRAD